MQRRPRERQLLQSNPGGRGKRNAAEQSHRGQGDLFDDSGIEIDTTVLRKGTSEVADRAAAAVTVNDVTWAAQRYADLQADPDTVRARLVADAWCSALPMAGLRPTARPYTEPRTSGSASPSRKQPDRRHVVTKEHL